MARTILILHPGGLGDLLLAVPAIRRLRARFPDHEAILCGHEQASALLVDCWVVQHCLPIHGIACAALFGGAVPEAPRLKEWLARCDVAVAWANDETGLLAASFEACGIAARFIQSPFDSTLTRLHPGDRFLETLGEPMADMCEPALSIPDRFMEEGLRLLRDSGVPDDRALVLVHPGSGSLHKCVEPKVLASVIRRLEEQDYMPVILEGPADRVAVDRLLSSLQTNPIVLQTPTLSALAGALSRSRLYIGHDSGVTHLAALLGVETVAFFGPTTVDRWAPRGPHVAIFKGASCHCLTWEEVSRCLEKPCLDISPEEVAAVCIQRSKSVTPRNSSSSALSRTSPYVRVSS